MNRSIRIVLISTVLGALSTPVAAGGSAEAGAQAITHSLEAIGYSLEGAFKLASGVVAIPLISVGGIGEATGQLGHELWGAANTPPKGPFPVTDEVVTVGPGPGVRLDAQE